MKPKTREELNAIRHAEQQRLTAMIEGLPAGSLSGGAPVYDESDKGTWWASPDPAERRFAAEYFGVHGPQDHEGLSHTEKNQLYRAADSEVANITPEGIKAAKQQAKQDDTLKDTIWQKYQARYPETAEADFNAVGAAGARLLGRYGEGTLRAMAEHEPDQLVDMLADEASFPGYHSGIDSPAPFSGYHGRSASPSRDDTADGSMFADVKAWQIRHGYR